MNRTGRWILGGAVAGLIAVLLEELLRQRDVKTEHTPVTIVPPATPIDADVESSVEVLPLDTQLLPPDNQSQFNRAVNFTLETYIVRPKHIHVQNGPMTTRRERQVLDGDQPVPRGFWANGGEPVSSFDMDPSGTTSYTVKFKVKSVNRKRHFAFVITSAETPEPMYRGVCIVTVKS